MKNILHAIQSYFYNLLDWIEKIVDYSKYEYSRIRYNLYSIIFWVLRNFSKNEFHSWLDMNVSFMEGLVSEYQSRYVANLTFTREYLHRKTSSSQEQFKHLTIKHFL